MQLVLASTSPRRRELLALLGLEFVVCPPAYEERPIAGRAPLEQVAHFAVGKATSIAIRRPDDLVIGSDTVIELDGRLLGKPTNLEEARAMLSCLAGRAHHVHTALALASRAGKVEHVETATALVLMKPDRDQAIERYVATGESLGKAGAYSIQGHGGELIEQIEGDFTTVVGLPIRLMATMLRAACYPVVCHIDTLYQRRPYSNWEHFSTDCQKGNGSPRMK